MPAPARTQFQPLKWPAWLAWSVAGGIMLLVGAYQVWYQLALDPTRPSLLGWFEFLIFGVLAPGAAAFLFNRLIRRAAASERSARELDALRTQESYLLHAVASSANAIIGLDKQDCIVTWNRGAELMFGYTAGEVLGQPPTLLLQPAEPGQAVWRAIKARLAETGVVRDYEVVVATKDGRDLPAEITHTVVLDDEDRVLGSAAIVRDISHRKALEAEEQRRTQELAALYAVTAAMHAAMSVDGALAQALDRVLEVLHLESGKVYLLDRETQQLTLVAAQGNSEMEANAEPTITLGECLCGLAVQTGETLLAPDVIRDQRIIRTECLRHGHQACAAVPLLAREQMLGVLHVAAPTDKPFTRSGMAMLRSVGAQMGVAVENMRLREEARRAEALATLIQEMHHRIKNNLQTVADLLSLEMSASSSPEARKSLQDSINRIKSIAAVHQLLSLEQLRLTNITELARQVCDISQRHLVLPGRPVTAEVRGPAIYLPSKQATSLALVMNELVSNSFEHAFAPGQAGHIIISLDQSGGQVSVSIADDGQGLPSAVNLETNRGLGLQIVRTLVEKDLNGILRVENAANGSGLCVTLTFYK
jgi:PAS domain S-box-containing protein